MTKPLEVEILKTLKYLLKTKEYRSQLEIVEALSELGFDNVTQTKISRLLKKLGAIKARGHHNKIAYCLSGKRLIPNKSQTISSVVIDVKHNGFQIIIKTIKGAGKLISNIIENLGAYFGILGCIASDDTVFVIPSNITMIDNNIALIIKHLDAVITSNHSY